MSYKLTEGRLDGPADHNIVDQLSASLGVILPADYLRFLHQHNGGEGFIGENYIVLWKAEDIGTFNREYEVEKYAPGILLFGSDGGGEGYGFATWQQPMPIVRLPFIGMELRYATPVAASFDDLFVRLNGPPHP